MPKFQGPNGLQDFPAHVGQLPVGEGKANMGNNNLLGGFSGNPLASDFYGYDDSFNPFAGMGMQTVAQGFNTMANLPGALANQFGFVNTLNSANQQAYNQAAAPVQIARERNQTELAKANMFAPLLQALIGGLGGITKGMTGFADTASQQMAQLPSGSSARPVNFR